VTRYQREAQRWTAVGFKQRCGIGGYSTLLQTNRDWFNVLLKHVNAMGSPVENAASVERVHQLVERTLDDVLSWAHDALQLYILAEMPPGM
jgi:hypothetical protein